MTKVSAQEVFAYHKVTGCPVIEARALLCAMEPLLKERIFSAIKKTRNAFGLQDPIQDDPEIGALVTLARKEAEEIADRTGRTGRGVCHFIWREQTRILLEKHSIVWFSPSKMNPGIMYD